MLTVWLTQGEFYYKNRLWGGLLVMLGLGSVLVWIGFGLDLILKGWFVYLAYKSQGPYVKNLKTQGTENVIFQKYS